MHYQNVAGKRLVDCIGTNIVINKMTRKEGGGVVPESMTHYVGKLLSYIWNENGLSIKMEGMMPISVDSSDEYIEVYDVEEK